MIPKDIELVTFEDIKYLKDNSVPESKTLEYKKDLTLKNDFDKKEFLSDVSSFANTSGGDIIFGIKESSGIPESIEGIEIGNIDSLKQQLENILRDNLEPRMVGFTIKEVLNEENNYFLIIRISKSWIAPHRVNYKGHTKFYARNSGGKYELDVNELRIAFNLTNSVSSRIKSFREDRILKIVSNDTPIQLEGERFFVLHLVPLISLSQPMNYNIKIVKDNPSFSSPLGSAGWGSSFNFDGIVSFDSYQLRTKSYTQFFKNGIIEAVSTKFENLIDSTTNVLPINVFERELFNVLRHYFAYYKAINVDFPVFVCATLVNYKGFSIGVGNFLSQAINPHAIDRDFIAIPEILVEPNQIYFHQILRPIFDSIWNACGFERCFHYDEDGNYKIK